MKTSRNRVAAIAGMGVCFVGVACADGPVALDLNNHSPYALSEKLSVDLRPPTALESALSFRRGDRDTNRTILIIAGVILVIGLVDDDAALTIIGGAGVIYSLASQGQMNFRQSAFNHGLEFARNGSISFGMNGFGQYGISHENSFAHPGAYIQDSIRF